MQLLESNLFQIGLTALASIFLRLVVRPSSVPVAVLAVVLASTIVVSACLRVGEFYAYSDYYVRSFAFLGDDVSSLLVFLFFITLATGRISIAGLTGIAILVSGGKIALLLTAAIAGSYVLLQSGNRRGTALLLLGLGVTALAGYGVVLGVSHVAPGLVSAAVDVDGTLSTAPVVDVDGTLSTAIVQRLLVPNVAGQGACSNALQCFETQVLNALKQRWMSLVAGAWMTIQGGFPGEAYPGTAQALADMMLASDPWGINGSLGLSRADWLAVGHIQHPYAAFGAGYGPWFLAALFVLLGYVSILAVRLLQSGVEVVGQVCALYFLATVLLNQTQPWLSPVSYVLILLSYCATDIVLRELERRSRQTARHTIAAAPGTLGARDSGDEAASR